MQYFKQMEEEKQIPEKKKSEVPNDGPGYQFDGFKIEVNEKVSLTPIQWSKKKKHG